MFFIGVILLLNIIKNLEAKCSNLKTIITPQDAKTSGIGKFVLDEKREVRFVFQSCSNRANCSDFMLNGSSKHLEHSLHNYKQIILENAIKIDYDNDIFEETYLIYSDLDAFEEGGKVFKENEQWRTSNSFLACPPTYRIWASSIERNPSNNISAYIKAHKFSFNGDMNKAWQFCEKDSECKSLKNKSGNEVAINKSHEKDYLDFLATKELSWFDYIRKIIKSSAVVKNKCVDYFCE